MYLLKKLKITDSRKIGIQEIPSHCSKNKCQIIAMSLRRYSDVSQSILLYRIIIIKISVHGNLHAMSTRLSLRCHRNLIMSDLHINTNLKSRCADEIRCKNDTCNQINYRYLYFTSILLEKIFHDGYKLMI